MILFRVEERLPYGHGVPTGLWVAKLLISQATANKIDGQHHVSAEQARELLEQVGGLVYRWDDDADRGLRALITTRWGGRVVTAVLYPQGDDVFALGSIYPTG